MEKLILLTLTVLFTGMLYEPVAAQGCVAVRHFSSCSSSGGGNQILQPGEWTLNTNYRWFRSFRHFSGTEEHPDRVANNTEVINWQHSLDATVSYALSSRMAVNFTLPMVYNERSSLYEHGRTERHKSFSYGVADIRLGANYWVLDPYRHRRGNMALGLGIKLPTGKAGARDRFYNVGENGEAEIRPVDQSIQPGDGGFGFTAELHASRQLTDKIGISGGGFYLMSPREKNGVRTYRETLSPLLQNEAIMAVPDQYAVRGSAFFVLPFEGWGASLGGRLEGVPVKDLVGGNEGFRRPGYILSTEPGVSYRVSKFSINLSVPVALVRNRQQSVTDKETERLTGQTRHGDAAFADYLINLGVAWHFGSPKNPLQIFE